MTDTSHRIYAVAIALVVFFLSWAAIAAKPWATPKPDARIAALAQREAQLRIDARRVKQIVDQRQAAYAIALKQRRTQIAQANARSAASSAQSAQAVAVTSPSVRVVNLPPLTITRTS
jgi:hypothetical protein